MKAVTRRLVASVLIAALQILRPAQAETVLFWGTPGQAVAAQISADLNSAFLNLRAAGIEKHELAQALGNERSHIITSCKGGVRDTSTEATLVSLLRDKDFYYLPFYMMQNSDARTSGLLSNMQQMSGGDVDGGIAPSAQFEFTRWVFAVKRTLGVQLTGSQTDLTTAAQNSTDAYAAYVILRDKAEIENLAVAIGRGPVAEPEPSPQALADEYVNHILIPAIKRSNQSGDLVPLQQWAEDVRKVIVTYEGVPLSVNQVESALAKMGYLPYALKIFEDRANLPDANKPVSQVLLKGPFETAFHQNYASRGRAGMEPSVRVEWSRVMYQASPDTLNRLRSLVDRDHLEQVHLQPLAAYLNVRPDLVKNLNTTPLTDWCTGRPL